MRALITAVSLKTHQNPQLIAACKAFVVKKYRIMYHLFDSDSTGVSTFNVGLSFESVIYEMS
jgi:hypothetical protein